MWSKGWIPSWRFLADYQPKIRFSLLCWIAFLLYKVLKFDLYFFFKNKCDKKFNKRELPRNIETTYFNKITVTKIFKKAEINRVTLVRLLLLIWQWNNDAPSVFEPPSELDFLSFRVAVALKEKVSEKDRAIEMSGFLY